MVMRRKLPWRDYLTDSERNELALADGAKLKWQELNRARAGIVNRAIQRAKYAALSPPNDDGGRDGQTVHD